MRPTASPSTIFCKAKVTEEVPRKCVRTGAPGVAAARYNAVSSSSLHSPTRSECLSGSLVAMLVRDRLSDHRELMEALL